MIDGVLALRSKFRPESYLRALRAMRERHEAAHV